MAKQPGLFRTLWYIVLSTRRFMFSKGDIHALAAKGKVQEVEALLNERPKLVNLVDKMDYGTPLHWAAVYGQEEACRLLLDRGADVNAVDDCDDTPLFWSIASGERKIVRLLLDNGASLELTNSEGRTPLQHAVYKDQEKIAALLRKRANS
jgi:ankyrin repeat protein